MATEDIPLNKNGRVDANAHRIQQSRNLKSAILLLLDTSIQMDDHIKENKEDFKRGAEHFTRIYKLIILVSVVFSVGIVGFASNWTIAGGVGIAGGVVKLLTMVFGKS